MLQRDTAAHRAPGPDFLELPTWFLRFKDNTFNAFVTLAREYSPVARFPISPKRSLFLCSTPEGAQHVLQDNHKNYRKAVTYNFIKPVVGEGLLTSHGDLWLRQRRLVAPIFHRRRIQSYAATMAETTEELLERWERHGEAPLDIAESMSQVTLSIAGKLLFNRDIGLESDWIGDALVLLFRDVNQRIMSPLRVPRSVPTPQNRRVQKAIERLEKLVYGLIEERRGRAEELDDLLSMFMLAEDEETGEKMSDEQIRDELMTFIIAGHDTTSNLLSWALYLLSKHPGVRRRLEEEVDDVVSGQIPTFEEVRKLDYLEQVIDETFRLFPPAWTVEREPIEDDVICGYHIPAGSIVSVGPYFVHHNADVWDNPEGFDPDRFAPDKDRPPRYAHFPFGGGPRMCVGADFAILEAKLILGAIIRRFRLDLLTGHIIEPEGTVTLYPKHGIQMRLRRRS